MDNSHLTDANELSLVTGVPPRTIREQGRQWPTQKKVHGRGKNGVNVKYPVQEISAEYKAPYYQMKNIGYSNPLILPIREDLNQDRARELLHRYESAPEWCKQKALALKEVKESYEIFSKNKKKGYSKIEFSRLYNSRNKSLGITDATFDLIPTMSKSRLKKLLSKYSAEGLAGLLPSKDRGKPKAKINDEMGAYIVGLIKRNPDIRPVRVYEYLINKFSGTDYPKVVERTVRNYINEWKAEEKELYCHMRNPDKHRSQYQAAFGSQSQKAEYFLHIVELDATIADVQCADGKRYKVSAAIDIFSRKVIFVIVPSHNSIAIGCTLLRLVMLKWGIPHTIVRDNGAEYTANHIDLIGTSLDINLITLPPFSPELKPFVERIIGSLAVGLLEELPGFVGHDIAGRKDIEARRPFARRMFTPGEVIECRLTADEFQRAVYTWTEKIYHQRVQSELGMSPEQKASQSTQPVRTIKDPRELDILLSPGGERTVLKKGISFEGGRYAAVELAEHMGEKVQIRVDLANAGKIFVFDLEKKFICIARDLALEPFTVNEAKEARRRQRLIINEKEKALRKLAENVGDPMAELLEAKRKTPGQIRTLLPEVPFENMYTREARKALDSENTEPVSTYDPSTEIDEKSAKVVIIKGKKDDFFKSELERYKYLQKKEPCEHTEKDRLFMKRYEESEEHNFLFRLFEQQNY